MKYKLRDNSSNQVFSQYGVSNPVVQLYSSHTEINRGDQLQITVFQNGYTDLSYVITGGTSANLNGADVSGLITELYTVLSFTFTSGQTYVFDQSNPLNTGYQIVFGSEPDASTNYITGKTIMGTPGQPGAYTQLDLSADFTGPLFYYHDTIPYMGSVH